MVWVNLLIAGLRNDLPSATASFQADVAAEYAFIVGLRKSCCCYDDPILAGRDILEYKMIKIISREYDFLYILRVILVHIGEVLKLVDHKAVDQVVFCLLAKIQIKVSRDLCRQGAVI